MMMGNQSRDRGCPLQNHGARSTHHPFAAAPWVRLVNLVLLLSLYSPARAVAQSTPAQPATVSPTPNASPNLAPDSNQPSPAPTSSKQPATKSPPKPNADAFPPNPLDSTTPDPLLPQDAATRPLTAAERKQIAIAADGLNAQAAATLKRGDRLGAFALWYRELHLRRALGTVEEVTALGRVGDTAWRENSTTDIRWITKRLDAILTQTDPTLPTSEALGSGAFTANLPTDTSAPASATPPPASPGRSPIDNRRSGSASAALANSSTDDRTGVLNALGLAYQQVRLPQIAVGIYQQILAEAKQRHDERTVDATLIMLGQLDLSWFDYSNAATTYRELLQRAEARGDQPNAIIYLTQLAYTHEQANQPEEAIKYQQ